MDMSQLMEEETMKYNALGVIGYMNNLQAPENWALYDLITSRDIEGALYLIALERPEKAATKYRNALIGLGVQKREKKIKRRIGGK